MTLLQAALPLVLGLLAVELGWALWRRLRVYRLADSLTDLGCAAMAQVVDLTSGALSIAAYAVVARVTAGWHPRLAWPEGPWSRPGWLLNDP